ncbi:RecX family transcriptional regulator [Deinococcus lacus]|uniref:Regulatory protein RecX n=1 Tax=Deinococcus lacus TaxID=392561 RepID=A0ABW1YCR3_9DEIO
MSASPQEKLLAYAFRALSRRALTEAELRERLGRRAALLGEDAADHIGAVLARVQELGYQDDAQVAQSEGRRTGVGSFRIGQKLRQRGVSRELIEGALQERDPEAEVADAVRQLSRRWATFERKRPARQRLCVAGPPGLSQQRYSRRTRGSGRRQGRRGALILRPARLTLGQRFSRRSAAW